jgi:hypothetical protein
MVVTCPPISERRQRCGVRGTRLALILGFPCLMFFAWKKVKSLSPNHRFVIALCSLGGVDETVLPQYPAEKKAGKLAREIDRDIFSNAV